jgi:hypothetical protein
MKRWSVFILGLFLLFGLTKGAECALIDYNLSGQITDWTLEDWDPRGIVHPQEVFGISVGDHFKINFTLDTNAIQSSINSYEYWPTFFYDHSMQMSWDLKIKQYYVGLLGPYLVGGGTSFSSFSPFSFQNSFQQFGWDSLDGALRFVSKSGDPVYFNGIENILNLDNFYSSFYLYGDFRGYIDDNLEVGGLIIHGEIDKLKTKYRPVSNLSASLLQESGNFVGTIDTLNAHPVPEPSTLLLLGSGLLGLAWFGKRRFRK